MAFAKEVMTVNPTVCSETATIYDAVRLMRREGVGTLPVIDADGRYVGLLVDREFCMRLVLEDLEPRQTLAGDLMNIDLITCHPDEVLESVMNKMEREQLRHIPVVNDADQVVGIISEGDIARGEVGARSRARAPLASI